MKPLRLGIVGLGAISRFYVDALEHLPSLRLGAVCDVDDAALARFRGQVPRYRSHHDMLRGSDIDAVVVTVPNDAHATVCRDALEAGLPVCVEKPLATRLADAEELGRCAQTYGIPLFTAFHRRYNSAVRRLARRLPHGRIESMTVRYLERIEDHVGPDRWYLDPARCGGGCVADNGPNAFDLARLFLGDVYVSDAAIERDVRGIDRQARIALRSTFGATATVELDWSYDGERKDVEIRLMDGSAHVGDMLHGHPGFKGSLAHEYVGVLGDFARGVSGGGQRRDGGLPALGLVEAAYRCERRGPASSLRAREPS